MDNTQAIRKDFYKWYKSITATPSAWEGNNLHIDEIECFKNISRKRWVEKSLEVFNYFIEFLDDQSLLLFLHFELTYSNSSDVEKEIDILWIKENLSEFTPPSFNFCSKDYFNDFYKDELIPINPDLNMINSVLSEKIVFYIRKYYDSEEKLYSREIYIFQLDNNNKAE